MYTLKSFAVENLPAVPRLENPSHFLFALGALGITVIPATVYGASFLSDLTGFDTTITMTPEAVSALLQEFYRTETSPTLD